MEWFQDGVVARGAWEIREVSGKIIKGQAPGRSGAIDETHEPDVFAHWWFLQRSRPGRQSLALSGQTKHLHTGRACLHSFLHSRRRGAAHHAGKTSGISSYRDPGRA